MWTIYRHSRGMLYVAGGTALHSEDLKPYQLYRCLYDNELSRSWIRPLEMFHENLSSGEPRFTPLARVRVVAPEDEREVLAMGFAAWGAGRTLEEFISSYQDDAHHLRGTAYSLELLDGSRVSALNTVRLSRHRYGLSRVVTEPQRRGQGYATMLLQAVMELLRADEKDIRFLLFSEIGSSFYERLGFQRLPDEGRAFLPFEPMVSGDAPASRLDPELLQRFFQDAGKNGRGALPPRR